MRTKTHCQLSTLIVILFPLEIRPMPSLEESSLTTLLFLILIRTRNPVFDEFVNNKGADQPVHSHSLISAFKQH